MQEEHAPNSWLAERRALKAKAARAGRGFNTRLAVRLTKAFGSMGAFYLLAAWMALWMLLATAGVSFFRHDPYPFTFLLFLSNIVQLLALPILAVGQQVLGRAAERQAEQTYRDAEEILKLQDEVHRLIKINNRLTEEIHAATTAEQLS